MLLLRSSSSSVFIIPSRGRVENLKGAAPQCTLEEKSVGKWRGEKRGNSREYYVGRGCIISD